VDGENLTALKAVYYGMAAVAGAVTALSFMRWREMTWPEVCLTLFVGFSFAIFVTPWIAFTVLGLDPTVQITAGLTYLSASGSNSLLPLLIRRIRRMIGEEELP
jgi:Mg/Co/Ni transporter MgtE